MQKPEKQSDAENDFMTPVMINDDGEKIQENEEKSSSMHIGVKIFIHFFVVAYFSYATYNYISTREYNLITRYVNHSDCLNVGKRCTQDCSLTLCSPFGMLLLVIGSSYFGLIYFKLFKPLCGDLIYGKAIQPTKQHLKQLLRKK